MGSFDNFNTLAWLVISNTSRVLETVIKREIHFVYITLASEGYLDCFDTF